MGGRKGSRAVAREGTIVCRARPVDVSPWTAMRAFAGPRVAWAPPDGPTIVGCGVTAEISADGDRRFERVRTDADAVFSSLDFAPAAGVDQSVPSSARPRLLGGFSFHESHRQEQPWRGFPAARFVLPRLSVVRDGEQNWVTATTSGPDADAEATEAALDSAIDRVLGTPSASSPRPGIESVRRNPGRDGWRRQVRSVLDRIIDGDVEKVVLAGTLTATLRGPVRLADTLARFSAASPDCFRFAIDPGLGNAFCGATPERLITRRGRSVNTAALAGSIGRGGTVDQDERLARRLTETPRLRHEHDLVADTIRRQLDRFATAVDVGEVRVRKLGSVQHLETPIDATLGGGTHVLDLVAALHPTPAVGGLPPNAAQRLIRRTEGFDRGWYAAPIGWFDAEGDGSFAVGIRSAVSSAGEATLFAGNGIVQDSDPDEEWDELQLKYRPVLDQLGS